MVSIDIFNFIPSLNEAKFLVETLKSRAISESCTFEAESCLTTTLNNLNL